MTPWLHSPWAQDGPGFVQRLPRALHVCTTGPRAESCTGQHAVAFTSGTASSKGSDCKEAAVASRDGLEGIKDKGSEHKRRRNPGFPI